MKLPLLLPICAVFAGCAAAPTVGRVPPVPPLAIEAPRVHAEVAARAAAERPVREPAVVEDLDAAPRTDVVYRTFTRIVEVPVEVERVVHESEPAPVVYQSYDYERRARRGGWFPINTLVGAGVGAAIGRHNGRTARGAWIGAHTGLLFDLARWW